MMINAFYCKFLGYVMGVMLLGSFIVCAAEPAEIEANQWRYEFKPLYLWFLNLEGGSSRESSGDSPGGSNVFDESELTSAFTLHFEVGKGDWTVFADYLYAEYGTNNLNISALPIQGSNILTVHLTELGVAYRAIKQPWYRVELLGGIRYMHIANKFNISRPALGTSSAKANIWDGFGGVRLTGFLTDSLSATVRADVGGGSSDLVWNVAAIVDWRYLHWGSVYAGYRVLDYKVSNANLGLNLQAKGPVVGLGFNW